MGSVLLLVVCFVLGAILRAGRVADEKGPDVLNAVIIYMALPALALTHGHKLSIDAGLMLPAAMPWIVFGAGYILFSLAGRLLGLDKKTVVCLTLVAGLGNTSFVGVPMIEAFFGPELVGVGMVIDLAGTFMVLAVPGMILAARAAGHGCHWRSLARKVLLFPPVAALVLGIALQPVALPGWLIVMLERLGSTLAPLALLSVGMTLRPGQIKSNAHLLTLGLGYKLLLAPALILTLYMVGFGQNDIIARVTIFEAAMGPMITGGIIAMTYGLNPSLAAALMGVGIPLSFLTIPVWYWVMR
ncbi:AEC family transporter [Pseudodesulfovibrio sp. F-1]|uniref:AEC family transporter n=1 Tax=Pseudodesulfovibrio alkaliphilus TaxID=2661613 RepID=A0A7K1KR70_9BACT|nr:AEC family transporter [Pseudodesulfovibrio alkaliphilus]MUM78589.1 AEC family transporter [Pseudodesulfovibrio alkaliphilus]